MKKLLVLFLVLATCISAFFACGDSDDKEEKGKSDEDNKETLSESTPEEESIGTEAPDDTLGTPPIPCFIWKCPLPAQWKSPIISMAETFI